MERMITRMWERRAVRLIGDPVVTSTVDDGPAFVPVIIQTVEYRQGHDAGERFNVMASTLYDPREPEQIFATLPQYTRSRRVSFCLGLC